MSTARLRQMLAAFKGLGQAGWKPRLMKSLAQESVSLTKTCFEDSRDPYGRPWKKLNPAFRVGQPLRDNGFLMNSIHAVTVSGRGFTVGTNHPGAKLHNYGGTVKAKPGKRLVFTAASGLKVFAKEVTIPARPFFPRRGQVPKSWVAALDETAADFMRREVRRAR